MSHYWWRADHREIKREYFELTCWVCGTIPSTFEERDRGGGWIASRFSGSSKVDICLPHTQHVNSRIVWGWSAPAVPVLVQEVPGDHREECQTILKLTCWVCGTNSSTFERV